VQIRAGANFETCYAHIMRGFAAVALLVAVVGSALSAQTLRDRVREFGREHPNAVYRFPRAPVDFGGPQTIEGIARSADVVVQCQLIKGDTRLVADEVVVTDYAIVEPLLLAGRLPAQQTSQPGAPTTPMTLSVWGGKMLVDGVPVEAAGGYAPKEGSTYVLFLRPARRSTLPNNYVLNAEGIFETDGDRVIPLFRDAINVFGGTIDQDMNAFTARIRNAVRTR
jgi:hypothetical protein